jgi:hypothetical protein
MEMSITVTGRRKGKDGGWHKGGRVEGIGPERKETILQVANLLARDVTAEKTGLDPVDADENTVTSWTC